MGAPELPAGHAQVVPAMGCPRVYTNLNVRTRTDKNQALEDKVASVQEGALPLLERFSDSRTVEFARKQREVIARFGRFPHHDAALERVSRAQELAFLQTPGSRF